MTNYAVVIFFLGILVCDTYVKFGLGHINVANMIQPGTWSPDGREKKEDYYRRYSWHTRLK